MSGYIICREHDDCAVLKGSVRGSVQWGTDPEQVLVFEGACQAGASLLGLVGQYYPAYISEADFWQTAQRILKLMADGHFLAHDDLEAFLPGVDYRSVLDAMVAVGMVEAVSHEEYGEVYFLPRAKEAQC